MDWQTVVSIGIVVLLSALLYFKRKQIEFQGRFPFAYAGMIRTQFGIKLMDWGANKFGFILRPLSVAGIYVGFMGMILIVFEVLKSTWMLFTSPNAPASVQPVLPINAPGFFYVPFLFWILSIFVIAVIHEFSHGVVARLYKIKVKSSGFAFLGILIPIIPAAFVEPDEKKLNSHSKKEQLAVFAAGPFSNILFSFLLILLFFPAASGPFEGLTQATNIVDMTALSSEMYLVESFAVTDVVEGSAAAIAGIAVGDEITHLDGLGPESATDVLSELLPGQELTVTVDGDDKILTLQPHSEDSTRGQIGVSFAPITVENPAAIETYGVVGFEAITFTVRLFFWIILLGLGIGLFNLVPLGPVDGGRMLLTALRRFFSEQTSQLIWKRTSLVVLALILINLFFPWIQKLLAVTA